jgi:hypothetical protein
MGFWKVRIFSGGLGGEKKDAMPGLRPRFIYPGTEAAHKNSEAANHSTEGK